jgi:hypothetical protein
MLQTIENYSIMQTGQIPFKRRFATKSICVAISIQFCLRIERENLEKSKEILNRGFVLKQVSKQLPNNYEEVSSKQ